MPMTTTALIHLFLTVRLGRVHDFEPCCGEFHGVHNDLGEDIGHDAVAGHPHHIYQLAYGLLL